MGKAVPSAERLYEEFSRRREAGEGVSIEEYCERFPDRATALRLMHSVSGPTPPPAQGLLPASGLGAIGKYQLLRSLGAGGFGAVYLALQPNPSRQVALKVLKPGMDTREFLARFETERETLALLNHPNIATIYEAGETSESRPYLVMEYVAGKPITDYCDEKGLTVRERLEVFLKLVRAVQHAHQHGVIHRDLKPLNVLVTTGDDGPEPKVIDFGLAKATGLEISEKTLATQDGHLVGTPMYMAPEQFDSPQPPDRRVDVYALGVILYELLSGERPLEFPSPIRYSDLLRVIREQEPITPSRRVSGILRAGSLSPDAAFKARQLSKEIRGELDWITMKALEKDPRRRYSSASDLASDIACYLKGEAVIAGPPSKAYRLRKFAWKHRGKLLAAAAALMVAAYPTFSYVREIARARGLMAEARGSCEAYMGLAREAEALYLEWRESRNRLPAWAPVWERSEELDAWRRLLGLIGRIQPAHVAAVGAVGRAFEADLGTRVRADLAGRLEEVVAVHFTGASGGKLALGELQKELPGPVPGGERALGGTPSAVSLQSDPAGAEVYCFRFEEREARWMPLPFDPRLGRDDPAKGVREIDYLLVDRLWPRQGDGSSPPFATGDRLVTVNGEVVRSFGDLARVLTNVKGDHPAEVEILREGDKKTARWVPWLASRAEWMRKALEHYGRPVDQVLPGRLVDPALQLGVTFAAYPLDCSPANLLGTTGPGKLLEFEVPAGSYLFILRRPGHEDVRLPIVARERVIRETVRLPEATAVPKGFIYIPAGTAATGGDPKADQSFEWDYVPVGAFFISKFELSSVEWLEFLNDERILAGIGEEEGRAPPRSPQVIGELGGLGVKDVQLVPKSGKNLYLEKAADGRWAFSDADRGHYNAFWTALHVSHHAALEYVHWRNEVAEERREPWVYRLPTDLEWERAARGADRRHFAWGNYLVWSFCRSQQGVLFAQPGPSGSVPFDESVFGVRDLTGSVREHTSGNPFGRFRTTRGGNFDDVSDVYFRLASRNGFLPHNWDAGLGVRLVAEPRR